MPEITIYTKPWCGFCWRAKRRLAGRELEFTEIDVSESGELEAEMVRLSGRTTVPQIFVDGTHLGDSERLEELAHSGEFDSVFGINKQDEG